ncbi:hypothetical protein AB0C08_36415 [Microbispora bryophytorum]|uniref:hypothetical protein n=1 Tax=Microbispora bryophytorum TaxID=1460882 RepID=UPI0033FA11B0
MAAWWSWALTAVGVTGLLLAGQRRALGWAIGLSAQALWIAYALATTQYGFLVSAVVYGGVYARNYLAWRREPTSVRTSPSDQPSDRRSL